MISHENTEELTQYLAQYPWEAWFHGTAEPGTSFEKLDYAVGRIRGKLADLSSLRVSSVGFCAWYPQPHVHVLFLGMNSRGETLAGVSDDLLEEMVKTWKASLHRPARFEKLYCSGGAIGYIVGKNVIGKKTAILSPRGLKLLKKYAKGKYNGYANKTFH